jgi:hypothetical protein
VSAMCKRLDEIIPFLSEKDSEDFLEHTRRLHARIKKSRERSLSDNGLRDKSLEELVSLSCQMKTRERDERVADHDDVKHESAMVVVVVPWEPDCVITQVLSMKGETVIVRAMQRERTLLVCMTPDQVCNVEKRFWPLFVVFFIDQSKGVPAVFAETRFGYYCAEQIAFSSFLQ